MKPAMPTATNLPTQGLVSPEILGLMQCIFDNSPVPTARKANR